MSRTGYSHSASGFPKRTKGESETEEVVPRRDPNLRHTRVIDTLFGLYPFLLKLYADGGYQGPRFQAGLRRAWRQVDVEIVN